MSENDRSPEFNNGFVTALGLFYGHAMDRMRNYKEKPNYDLVLNGATDHLCDIEYPNSISGELREEIEAFVEWAFTYRLKWDVTRDEVQAVFEKCKELLIKIDEEVFGLEVEAGYG